MHPTTDGTRLTSGMNSGQIHSWIQRAPPSHLAQERQAILAEGAKIQRELPHLEGPKKALAIRTRDFKAMVAEAIQRRLDEIAELRRAPAAPVEAGVNAIRLLRRYRNYSDLTELEALDAECDEFLKGLPTDGGS